MRNDNIKLKKGMNKDEVNELISEWLLLEDHVYNDAHFKHNWKCKCGNIIKNKAWNNIYYGSGAFICNECQNKNIEEKYKHEVEKDGEYEYIRSYRNGDVLPNGKIVKGSPYIQIKHKYCGSIYETAATTFINKNKRCGNCCQTYENSFAYHIEVELGEPLDKYWDFEKNTVNPYNVYKSSKQKVWIKCAKAEHHGDYIIDRCSFIRGSRCPYCSSKKVHPKDSFAQYHIDNTDKDFLEKYWDYEKNKVDPWKVSPSSNAKIWIKCQNEEINEANGLIKKDYHGSYETTYNKFTSGVRCHYCCNQKIHTYDSFGYNNFELITSYHSDNNLSPFKISPKSGIKCKFICKECGDTWETIPPSIISSRIRCPKCRMSKGEDRIYNWLELEGLTFIHDKPYFEDLLSDLGNPLRPDFILPDYKIWIEYDGEFHYEDLLKNGSINLLKYRDKLKDEYANNRGWKMIRIPYWDYDNIEKILEKEVKDA